MENKTKSQQIDAEQAAADKLEGYERATDEVMDLIRRHRELTDELLPLLNEKKAIEELVKELQIEHGIAHLTFDGIDQTTLSKTVTNTFDKKAASQKLGVEVLAQFYTSSVSYRLIIKK